VFAKSSIAIITHSWVSDLNKLPSPLNLIFTDMNDTVPQIMQLRRQAYDLLL